jgi:multiple sugar transport system substrate-binding protein
MQIARSGRRTLPVRRSLASSPAWYDPSLSASERTDLGTTFQQSLGEEQCLTVPRIPAIDEYLAALDDAVQRVVFGDGEPEAALEQAAADWEKITDAHGRDAQREAYLKHLGLNKP